jgi:cysteine desulfuration protein SufE
MELKELQDKIIDDFSVFDDWMDKYNFLIEIGKELPVIDPVTR